MTKKELTNAIAEKAGISIKDAGKTLDALTEEIYEALAKGDIVRLQSIGTFKVETKGARSVRNPRTGQIVNVPSKRVVKFKISKSLNKAI